MVLYLNLSKGSLNLYKMGKYEETRGRRSEKVDPNIDDRDEKALWGRDPDGY